MTCPARAKALIDGGYILHHCGLPEGHDGMHECFSMRNHSDSPCTFVWQDDATPDSPIPTEA